MERFISILSLILLFGVFAGGAEASPSAKLARPSATLKSEAVQVEDNRTEILEAYLTQYNSPFADQADVFVREADKYGLDWKFVAAISGIESTFGQRYPEGTYNAWGWGIYGTNMHYFESWEDAIVTITSTLRTKYMNTWGADDVHEIGSYYAANPTWSQKVLYFMNQIEAFENEYENTQLSLLI